jgi:ABC-type amino acid transport system permease subunit
VTQVRSRWRRLTCQTLALAMVLLGLTVTEPQTSGWLSAYPYGVDRPLVSNLNFTAGMVVPNLSLATLGDGYGVLYNGSSGTVQIVVDVLAYVL